VIRVGSIPDGQKHQFSVCVLFPVGLFIYAQKKLIDKSVYVYHCNGVA